MSLFDAIMAKSPVGYWRDATGADASGNDLDLTPFGDPADGASLDASDPDNPSILLDGSNNVWNPDHYAELDLAAHLSLFLLLNLTAVDLADLARKGTGIYGIYCDGTNLRGFLSADTGVEITGETEIEPDSLVDVLLTYDGAGLKLYVNGELDATGALTGAIEVNNGAAFTIGLINDGPVGRLDEVALFDTALTAGDATAFHAARLAADGGGALQLRVDGEWVDATRVTRAAGEWV